MIDEYFSAIKALLDRYAATPFVLAVRVTFDRRPGDQGYLTGAVAFADGSTLSCREFLDGALGALDKLSYSYHYQDAEGRLIFRYDNAMHRPPPPSREHKHGGDLTIEAPAPELETVLSEVAEMRGWL